MKPLLTLIPASLLSLSLFAQPSLQSAEMLPIGNTINMRILQHFDLIDTTLQGANATWDFTALSVDLGQPAFNMTVVDPATTPGAADFPTSNYAYRESPNNYYRYFNLTPTKMERLGSYTNAPSIFIDPQIEYVFPLALGTTNTDTWETFVANGTYSLRCIGTGTLMLPGVTFSDALMVRVHVAAGTSGAKAYFWYSSENGAILLQYVVNNGSSPPSGLFAQGIAAGVGELANAAGATVNNPVADELVLSIQSPQPVMQYSILSVTGALQRNGQIAAGSSEERMWVSDLAPGMYVLMLHSQQGAAATQALRFLKE